MWYIVYVCFYILFYANILLVMKMWADVIVCEGIEEEDRLAPTLPFPVPTQSWC